MREKLFDKKVDCLICHHHVKKDDAIDLQAKDPHATHGYVCHDCATLIGESKLMETVQKIVEEKSNKERKVAETIKAIRELDYSVFYPALLIYDVLGIDTPSEELIRKVEDLVDDVDTVYDEMLREAIKSLDEEVENKLSECNMKEEAPKHLKCGHTKGKIGEKNN